MAGSEKSEVSDPGAAKPVLGFTGLIPVRILNEYVYCPRLAYLMWVQGEFAHNADTVEGHIRHKRVDRENGSLPAETDEEAEAKIHAQSVSLSSERLGITAKIDLVEGEGSLVTPVDYKKGKRPHVAAGAYAPERVQVCAQGLLLREHGFSCDGGVLYFHGSRERVPVRFDDELIAETLAGIQGLRQLAVSSQTPPPLADSPKCARCSLLGICLPDEVRFLNRCQVAPRPVYAAAGKGLPLYVQAPRAYLRKDGEQIVVEEKKEKIAEARLNDVSQVVLYGSSGISTPLLHECMTREIPVTFLSYGGWFVGHMIGTGHKNVGNRTGQYRASFDPDVCLKLARNWVAAKIANCRTLLRRNWKLSPDPPDQDKVECVLPGEETEAQHDDNDGGKAPRELMLTMRNDIGQAALAKSLETLLGVEGNSARHYFQNFTRMLSCNHDGLKVFDLSARNRRPPKDPINAMLSFAYAMLTREWTVALSAVGLDPYRGFFHQPRFGRPALALDMMEPFRPLVADSAVIMAVNNGEVRPEDFVTTAVGCNLKAPGRKRFIAAFERRMEQEITHPIFKYRVSYRRLFEVQARLLARYLTGEIPRYPNFVTR